MKVIGITGGVGSGKSAILQSIEKRSDSRVLYSDLVAKSLYTKGEACYKKIVDCLGQEILDEQGDIDKALMAKKMYSNKMLIEAVNNIVHPAVKERILDTIQKERQDNKLKYFFVEAALLIEDGYLNIVDEMWYIHASVEVRKERLKASRGYSEEKIESILKSQLSEEDFYNNCKVVIENSGLLEDAINQVNSILGEG